MLRVEEGDRGGEGGGRTRKQPEHEELSEGREAVFVANGFAIDPPIDP